MIFGLQDKKIEDYCINMSSPVPDYLLQLERETNLVTTMPQMLSGRLQGRFLSLIGKILNADIILEIGTFTGYSALCLAEGLSSKGRLISIELDIEMKKIIDKYFEKSPFGGKIEVLYGDAKEIIPELDVTVDMVFIDAHKPDYILYYEETLRLLRPGGVILTDNVLWSGKVIYEPDDRIGMALHQFNEHVKNDERTEKIMLPFRDGISIIRKK
jgi:predicted O-methyltransferase YrrM